VVTVAVIALIEVVVAATATHFMESQPLIYQTKLDAFDDELAGDIIVFGDSTAVASVVPEVLQRAVPNGMRIVNWALPGSGPVVAEYLMEKILEDERLATPELVILSFSTLSFTDWRSNFVEYPLTHLLPLGPVVKAAWAEGDVGYLLEWVATRLPSLRHREEIKTGALSIVFDRWPALAERYRVITANADLDSVFAWRHFDRVARNDHLAMEILAGGGWRLFEEMRLPGGELDRNVRYDQGRFYFPPFEATGREEQALERLLDLCEANGIRVLVLPSAQPEALDAALALEGGGDRIEAFEQRMFGGRPNVLVPLGLRLPWPHAYFADLAHVNEAGAERYGDTMLPVLRASAAGLRSVDP
jgi:hypothetical protein